MVMIRIICVGKRHETMYTPAIEYFEQKIKHHTQIAWRLLPHSTLASGEAIKDESKRILASIEPSDYVLLLDERGSQLTSPELAELINKSQYSSQNISIVIGGAFGVNDGVRKRANATLSFGRVVFPHQLVRLMIIEQLYRAYSINSGSKYHHL